MKTCDKRYIKPLFREVHSESVEDEVEKMEKNYFETFSADNFKFLGKIKYLSQKMTQIYIIFVPNWECI